MSEQAKLVTINGTAQILGRSRASIYRDIRSGQIPTIRIGARQYVRRDWLDRLVASPDPAQASDQEAR